MNVVQSCQKIKISCAFFVYVKICSHLHRGSLQLCDVMTGITLVIGCRSFLTSAMSGGHSCGNLKSWNWWIGADFFLHASVKSPIVWFWRLNDTFDYIPKGISYLEIFWVSCLGEVSNFMILEFGWHFGFGKIFVSSCSFCGEEICRQSVLRTGLWWL